MVSINDLFLLGEEYTERGSGEALKRAKIERRVLHRFKRLPCNIPPSMKKGDRRHNECQHYGDQIDQGNPEPHPWKLTGYIDL